VRHFEANRGATPLSEDYATHHGAKLGKDESPIGPDDALIKGNEPTSFQLRFDLSFIQLMNAKRVIWIGGLVSVLVAGTVMFLPTEEKVRLRSRARKQWKESALAEIARWVSDSNSLTNEIARLRAEAGKEPDDGWIGTNTLGMTNGEWLLYRNKCVKEPGSIHDLFLARGSDGKWYYSTFHFCTRMITLRGRMFGDEDHASIAQFARVYAVHDFDFQSEECLKKTWPVKK
jgi:hypothetical protein